MSTTNSKDLEPAALEAAVQAFRAEHPDLVAAMEILGISNLEYQRAVTALHFAPIRTTTSTQS